MRGWLHVIGLLVLFAPNLGAQALLPSRFGAPAPTEFGAVHGPSPFATSCDGSKRGAVLRGAIGGFLVVGGVGFAVVLVRVVYRVATFRSGMQDFPLLELAVAGAVLGAVLEGAAWERRCG